jgi:hypothetical protein
MRRRRGFIWVIWNSPVWERVETPDPLRQEADYATRRSRRDSGFVQSLSESFFQRFGIKFSQKLFASGTPRFVGN